MCLLCCKNLLTHQNLCCFSCLKIREHLSEWQGPMQTALGSLWVTRLDFLWHTNDAFPYAPCANSWFRGVASPEVSSLSPFAAAIVFSPSYYALHVKIWISKGTRIFN
ncbi:hypothetical protein GQ55_9G605100 [Panicum hallii var. hallii]|uniref:Uncharacterized protein n=1 Tax=Panicum hallii var. hallii TaxID=1504633 RepID=A0A2T7CHB9_9POAL|nr:hypothetical protein GQ55_9G605100 [Panicum hallii var. hallii]